MNRRLAFSGWRELKEESLQVLCHPPAAGIVRDVGMSSVFSCLFISLQPNLLKKGVSPTIFMS